uniref:Uncharacterized protein n=1 Tax=Romanomermis culicivorax TaxID=13658 RepID=A0A915KJS5_ROMCU
MEQDKPVVVLIADPPITSTPADGSKGVEEEEKLMEIVESENQTQPDLGKLTDQIKEMKEKIEKKRQDKEKRIAQEENKAQLDK